MNEKETIDDIIAEKRLRAAEMEKTLGDQHSLVESLKVDADRLEAARKREVGTPAAMDALARIGDALNKKALTSPTEVTEHERAIMRICCGVFKRTMSRIERGNCAKLREALLAIRADILKRRSENCWYATDSDILEKIDAALAAPPRNCDEGTAKEQDERKES